MRVTKGLQIFSHGPVKALGMVIWVLLLAGTVLGQGSITPDSTWTTRSALSYTEPNEVLRLDLRDMRVPQFDFAPYRVLQAVHFGGSTFTDLPPSLAQAPLREVYLERTWNLNHAVAFGRLPKDSLRLLSLYNCNLQAIPVAVTTLPNLRVLNLEMNHLTTFPRELATQFQSPIEELYLGLNAEMEAFPEGVRGLRRLRVLHLDGTAIASIEHFRGLDSLTGLGLSGTPLRKLPSGAAWGNVRLRRLTLSNCPQLDWVQAFGALALQTSLNNLNISQNDLRAVPPLPSQSFPNLDTLVASNAQGVAALLPALTAARRIKYLDISRSRIDSLTLGQVLRLETLEYLDLSALDLKTIPEEVQYLREVHTLILQYNDLAPAEYARLRLMPELRVLRLSYGKYSPEELREIQTLLPGVSIGF